ncbi:MAG: PAS domain S-box protein [Acidobacteria bacterium]|nr:PAS domain S-box protein [Acidobacteriota bacterium]
MTPAETPPRRLTRVALGVAAAYVAVGGAWIYLSDRLVAGAAERGLDIQTLKGWGFVLVTGAAAFLLVWRSGVSSWRSAQADLARAAGEATREAVFEHSPDAGFVLEEGAFVAANRAAGRLLGCAPHRLVGAHPWDVSPENQDGGVPSPVAAWEKLAAARAGEVFRFPWRHRRFDGVEFDAEVSLTVLPGPRRQVLAWVRDVTERVQAGRALAASEERYRTLAEAAQDNIFIVDRDFRLAYVNEFGASQLGRPVGDLIGRRVEELFPAETAARQRGSLGRVLETGEPLSIEAPNLLGGREVWLDTWLVPLRESGGEVTAVLGMARDVTRRHRSETVRAALYRLSEATNSAASLGELFPAIHAIVGGLMPARNLYIALHEPATGEITFPYFADEFDPPPPPRKAGRGLTEYVLRSGEPFLADEAEVERLVRAGEIEDIGAKSVDWLGVPLRALDRTIGVLAVQSYSGEVRYGEEEKNLLIFVSAQVASAIERTRAEEAMRASEQRLREIVEHSTNMFFVHTPDHVLRYVSPQSRQFLDCEPEEALVRWTELTTDNPINEVGVKATQRAIDSGEVQPVYELELVGARGRVIWVEVNEAPVVRDGRTVAIVGALTDITERKRAEAALRESEERFRGIFENAVVGVYRTSPDGWVLMANPALVRMLAYDSFDELAAVNVAEAGYGPDSPRSTFIDRVEREGIVVGLEAMWRRRDGSHLWVRETARAVRDQEGRTLYYEGTVEDITARKETEVALAESEQRYRALVELSPDAIAVHSEGRIVFANQRGADMLGYDSADDLVGKAMLELVHPDYRALVARRARLAQEEGRGQPAVEEKLLRRDGSAIDVEISSIPFTYRGRAAVLVVVHDIRERLRVEEHLRQTQKLEAIGQLAGGVAHDFNNLLQALLSTVQVLRAGSPPPARLAAIVGELEAHVRRGASLTRQLLLFSRREVTKPEKLDLNAVVRDTHELLLRLVREDIRIRVEASAEALPVNADQGQLEQVLVNLVVNAVDAMPGGGELVVRTGREGGEWAWFEVQDSGVGMDESLRERIFEPFFTTKPAGKGTGLGLSVVHGIVTQHGGRIEVASEVGRGSTFRVRLRYHGSGDFPRLPAAPQPAPLRAGRGERILLVEDEKGARDGLHEMLTMLGYRVQAVDTGEAAEAMPAGEPFDVLLTDLMLPGVHGAELARRLATRWPGLRVVVMSGYTPDEAVRRGVSEGSVRFLQKPFDMDTVARELRAVLDGQDG